MFKADPPASDEAIEAEIQKICELNKDGARAYWRGVYRNEPPTSLSRDLLIYLLCWKVQEEAYGGHDKETLLALRQLALGKPVRRIKTGNEFVRVYQGKRHTVVKAASGYVWDGREFPSLTAIAREITGTNWNGPRFFGLRVTAAKTRSVSSPGAVL